MKKKRKRKKSNQKFSAWLKKNRNHVISALLVAILGVVIGGSLTGIFPWLWNLTFGNENDSIIPASSELNIEYNVVYDFSRSPIVLDLPENENWDKFLLRGKELIDNDSSETAIVFLKQMEDQYKNNALFYHVLSTAYTKDNNISTSIKYINKSIEIDDRREWAFISRAALFNITGDVDKALDDIKIAIYINKENPNAWILYGLTVLKKQDIASAEAFSDSALLHNPRLDQYFSLKRLINIVAEDFNKALAYDDSLSSVRQLGEFPAQELDLRARIYTSNGRYPEALDFIASSLNIDNTNADSWVLKATIYLKIGSLIPQSFRKSNRDSLNYINKQALLAADSALYHDEDNIDAMFFKSASLILLGYPERAIVVLESALELDSTFSDAWRLLEFGKSMRGKSL